MIKRSANDYTPARYRQTDSTANKWKVNFATTDNKCESIS